MARLDYTGRQDTARLKEELCAESTNGLDVGERCWGMRLRESRHEGQHEEENKQGAPEFRLSPSCLHFLGYKTKRLFEDRIAVLRRRLAR